MDEFSIRASYWEDYKSISIHMTEFNASCRMSIFNDEPQVALISDLYVNVDIRRKGYGNRLLNKCIKIAKSSGCRSVKLYSDKSWKMDWYMRHGFKEIYSCGNKVMLMKSLTENDSDTKECHLVGQNYAGGKRGYKIPDGYLFDGLVNDVIFLRPKT